MQYDFTSVIDRRGMDAIAVDGLGTGGSAPNPPREGFDIIPMWIADMNFPTCPTISQAIAKRAAHPFYGYFQPTDAYYDSIIRWQTTRNGVTGLQPEHIGYENGVLGGVSSAVQAFTNPGDKILIHSPTYVGFTHTMADLGRNIIHSELKRDEQGVWRMDYEDMDAKLKAHNIHFAVFCSPHNPCGRVWERWEIEKAMEIYAANNCLVVSDEIWSDIIMPGHRHVPTQSVSEDARRRTIALYAPSKTFSLAGLIGSYHIVYDPCLRHRLERRGDMSHYNSCNVLSMHALIGAYGPEGEEWAEQMVAVVDKNFDYACGFIRENFPGVRAMRPEGTYMLFLDVSQWLHEHDIPLRELLRRGVRCGVIWQNGEAFIYPDSIRMNLALPLSQLQEAMERLRKYAFI